MKYTYLLLLAFVSTSIFSQGQKKYAADKYFNKYSYVKSASLYEKVYEKGDNSELVVSRIADSYYYNNNYENAAKWYKELFATVANKEITKEYYTKYIQSLKSIAKYSEAQKIVALARTNQKELGVVVSDDLNVYKTLQKENTMFTTVENLAINTEYSDYNNIVVGDILYFSSTRPQNERKTKLYGWNKQPFYTMYAAQRAKEDGFDIQNISSLEGKVNGRYHDASPVITKDGKTMYFTRDNSKGNSIRINGVKTSNLKLFKTTLKKGKWSCAKELPFNNKDYSVGQPALSVDEKYLYFVSDMPGGYGKTDIYKVAITGEDTYGVPENLGNVINGPGEEMFPYVLENELYFSSDGHLGLGGLDVFKSTMVKNAFQKPENLGNPINSTSDDFSFVLKEDNGYFTSNRAGGKGDDDIYSFTKTKEEPEELLICEKQVQGIVYDKLTNEVLPGARVLWLDMNGSLQREVYSNAKGFYDLGKVSCLEGAYKLQVSKAAYNYELSSFEVTNASSDLISLTNYLLPLEIKIDKGNLDLHINPIYFDFDKSNIRKDAAKELNKVVKILKDFPEILLRIESHTDSRGNDSYNEKLSDRRAKSSRDYIISQGIPANRIISAKGYGEYRLLNDCDDGTRCSEKEHQLNRRSYFYISNNPKNVSVKNQVGE